MITDYFNLAIGNIKKRKVRSGLTVIGIFISIATIFILISLSIGLNNAINEQFRQLGSDKFFIMPKGQAGGPGSGGAVQLTTKDVDIVDKAAGVKDVFYDAAGSGKIEFNNQIRYYNVVGIPTDKIKIFSEIQTFKIDEGRFLQKSDIEKAIIGSRYKSGNIFARPVKISDKITVNGKDFKVVGIMQSTGSPTDDALVYLTYDDFKSLFKSGDRVDQIVVQVQPGENVSKVSDQARRKLLSFRGLTEKTRDFEIMTPDQLLSSFGVILNIITAFLVGVAGISLLVGSVGIANTMFTSVLERTKEIGTMKAIGAKNSDILLIFVIESGFLGIIGGILGVLLGMGVGKIIEYIAVVGLGTNLLQVAFPWYLIVGCLLFAFLVGALSGYFPARQASRIKPADTLRYE